jgi:hypothetical protein
MTKQLLMYDKVVPLNAQAHKDLYIRAAKEYGFAKDLNSVPLTAVEFPSAASEYAIVFAGTDEEVMPAVIMGVETNENLYCGDEESSWKANYIPAFIRRYPFVFSNSSDGKKLILCIDESYNGCNVEGRGERLFDADGEKSLYLRNVLGFLEDYQLHFRHTQAFCKKLVELDLLQPMTAKVNVADSAPKVITGFFGIDRSKLKALPAQTLSELAQNDWLELVYLHLQSIRNFGANMDRVMKDGSKLSNEADPEVSAVEA